MLDQDVSEDEAIQVRKVLVLLVVTTAVLIGGLTPAAGAVVANIKFASCADLLTKYPNGVAETKAAATKAVKAGFARPSVSTSIYNVNGSRLDRDKDGVMCEQSD